MDNFAKGLKALMQKKRAKKRLMAQKIKERKEQLTLIFARRKKWLTSYEECEGAANSIWRWFNDFVKSEHFWRVRSLMPNDCRQSIRVSQSIGPKTHPEYFHFEETNIRACQMLFSIYVAEKDPIFMVYEKVKYGGGYKISYKEDLMQYAHPALLLEVEKTIKNDEIYKIILQDLCDLCKAVRWFI